MDLPGYYDLLENEKIIELKPGFNKSAALKC
jgi:hypothetical protein